MLKKLTALFICTFILAGSLAGCGSHSEVSDGSGDAKDTEAGGSEATSAAEVPEYEYPEADFDGEEFTILNIEPVWDFYTYADFESMTGDPLDDAIYNRNRFIEQKFNMVIKEVDISQDNIVKKLQTAILSDDKTYDVAYIPGETISPLITEHQLVNLLNIPELNFDKPWWDQTIIKDSVLNSSSLYFALCDITFTGLQGAWAIYFNERMLSDLSLEFPYDLVRENKWTFDRYIEYIKSGTNLNGDESYEFNPEGNCIYGLTNTETGVTAMMFGMNERYIKYDDSNNPYFAADNERFYSVCKKISDLCSLEGDFCYANDSRPSLNAYDLIFKSGRALFMGGEIKATLILRDMEDNFGIVPNPKYDEEQENYTDVLYNPIPLLCIPITNDNHNNTGIVLDALAYKSYKDTMPVFYNVTLSQKGLRNDNSIEMLGIIRSSRYFDFGYAYGWTSDLHEGLRSSLTYGKNETASLIEKYRPKIAINIEKTMSELNDK